MFLGHYGLALALKRAEPKVGLGTLFLAVQLVDWAWAAFVLLGWEQVRIDPGFTAGTPLVFLSYPLSHSLVAAALWGLAAGVVYYSWPTKDRNHHLRATFVVIAAVASHWFLDLVVHIPDLPLAGDTSRRFGLGLWQHPGWAAALELASLGLGLALYLGSGSKRHPIRVGRIVAVASGLTVAFLAAAFGPPPPSVTAVGIGALVTYPTVALLAAWADQRRSEVPSR